MKQKTFFILSALLMVSFLSSCGGKKHTPAEQSSIYDDWEEREEMENLSIFGLCLEGSTMHSLQILSDEGDTLMLDMTPAQEEEKVYGGYAVGDRMALVVTPQRTEALVVIDMNTLMGDWVMENPIDGTSETGITIRDGGIAESINQSSMIYQTWKLVNGQLELSGIREGSGNYEETELYQIHLLTPDSLVFANSEETFEYTRPRKQEDYSDIELEDEGYDDIIF